MPIRVPRHSFASTASAPQRMTFKEDYGSEWRKLRNRRLREEPLCRHCSAKGYVTAAEQVDHILPLALGGKHEWENMRRFTRLTNAFSKKVEHHAHAVALHMMYYNFVRIHKTLRVTPAMAAGVADRLWEVADIAKLVEDAEAKPAKRGPYKSRVA